VPVDAYDREGKTKLASGTLAAVDNQIDPATGTVKLKASFANRDGALFPNQFVNARVLLDVLPNVVLAPSEAIQRGPQGAFVYVVKPDGWRKMRRLELGPSDGGLVAVKQGLAPGEAVVVDGAEKLQDGAKVEPGSGPPRGRGREPLVAVHPAARRDVVADGRRSCSRVPSRIGSSPSRRSRRSTTRPSRPSPSIRARART